MLRGACRSLSFLCSAIIASTTCAAEWPQWLGPNRNGVTSETVVPWEAPPPVLWRHEVGNGYSSPIGLNQAVIVHAAVAGKDSEEVRAYDPRTGKPLWEDIYERGPYRSQLGVGPRTTPTVADGRLYTYGITGVLSCYDVATGKRLWQTNPYDTFKATLPQFGVCSSPVVASGRVVVLVGGGGSAIVAFDAKSGELAWKGLDEPASSASPIAVVRGEGDQRRTEVVVQTTLRVVGMSPEDGTVRWEHPLVFQPSGVSPTPLLLDDVLVCTTQDTGTMALELNSASANPRQRWWKQDVTSYFSTGTVGPKGSVLVVTNVSSPLPRADLRCLSLAKGDELWRKTSLGYFHFGVISTGDGKLLVLDDAGNLILAEVTAEGFKQLAKSSVCRGTLTSPALAGGRLYVRDDRELICLELARPEAKSP